MKKTLKETTYVDHPVTDLRHAQASRVAQLLLFFFARVRVIAMAVQPVLQEVRRRLRELAPPALRACGHLSCHGGGLRGCDGGHAERGRSVVVCVNVGRLLLLVRRRRGGGGAAGDDERAVWREPLLSTCGALAFDRVAGDARGRASEQAA